MAGKSSKSTKDWNTDITDAPADELLYTDYAERAKTTICNYKFKTTLQRLTSWKSLLQDKYANAEWEAEENHVEKMRLKVGTRTLVIRLGCETGIVVVQGALMHEWYRDFQALKAMVCETTATATAESSVENATAESSVESSVTYQEESTLLSMQGSHISTPSAEARRARSQRLSALVSPEVRNFSPEGEFNSMYSMSDSMLVQEADLAAETPDDPEEPSTPTSTDATIQLDSDRIMPATGVITAGDDGTSTENPSHATSTPLRPPPAPAPPVLTPAAVTDAITQQGDDGASAQTAPSTTISRDGNGTPADLASSSPLRPEAPHYLPYLQYVQICP